jgi:hypothetical protein
MSVGDALVENRYFFIAGNVIFQKWFKINLANDVGRLDDDVFGLAFMQDPVVDQKVVDIGVFFAVHVTTLVVHDGLSADFRIDIP